MNILQILNSIIVIIGIPTIVGAFIYLGRKLQVLDDLGDTIKKEIKPDLKNLQNRFIVVEDRVETIWRDRIAPAKSPRQLNAQGLSILNESGIKEIVQSKKEHILKLLKEKNLQNPYDAERAVEDIMMNLPGHYPDIVDTLKHGAFKVGADLDAVLYAGSVYLRDLIFPDLGFKIEDLDK